MPKHVSVAFVRSMVMATVTAIIVTDGIKSSSKRTYAFTEIVKYPPVDPLLQALAHCNVCKDELIASKYG